jgi:predicted phage baseplate assembly protein
MISTKRAKRTKQGVVEELAQIVELNLAEAAVSVWFDWVEVGTLVDQPPAMWNGVSGNLQPIQPAQLKSGGSASILLQDHVGAGQLASGTAGGAGLSINWPATTATPLSPGLQPPINVLYNLLAVTRGKTVANEILGSGDGTVAGQSFVLAKFPVTYLSSGPTYASTIALTVNGQPWTEVPTFYGQAPDAQVFVTREDAGQKTHIDFGDGVNGSRLPTGNNNVVATYRIEAGADSPPAGKLTVIAQSYPGLQSVLNPVAVSGGSDPDPAALLRQYAPRSVLTFGRAVSVFDYQALAAQAPGVTMAAANWSWDAANQRAAVTVYVAGEANVAASVGTLLAAAGDPNRPVTVLQAKPVAVTLTMTLVVTAGMDQNAIKAAVTAALCDPLNGIFSPGHIAIGQGLFDSVIEAACLKVSGVIAIKSRQFFMNGAVDAGPLHYAGEGAYFSLNPGNFSPTTEAASND